MFGLTVSPVVVTINMCVILKGKNLRDREPNTLKTFFIDELLRPQVFHLEATCSDFWLCDATRDQPD